MNQTVPIENTRGFPGMRALSTIGYEGAQVEDFIATLLLAGVSLVLDVREMPISRRKGYSKSALAAHLETAGIAYRHEKRLGAPSDIRNALREDGDLAKYFRAFNRYLRTQSRFLGEVTGELKGSVALLCYERNPDECHRKKVAEAMSEISGIKPRHLGVQGGRAKARETKASGLYPRQSVSAA